VEERTESRLNHLTGWIVDILAVLCLAAFFVMMFGLQTAVEGHSMVPLLQEGDIVLTDSLPYHFKPVRRFDVVAFRDASGSRTYIRRVIGLPGETVQIRGGHIYINGSLIAHSDEMDLYTVAGVAENPVVLKSDEYFLLGDDETSSQDSRFSSVGNVSRKQIIGRIWFRIAPVKTLGMISGGY